MAVKLVPRAVKDLDEIWDYTAAEWSGEQADEYVRSLWRAIETLEADPMRGKPCDEIRPGYRKFRSASHVIFFRMSGEKVEIVRILHGAMDHDRHL